MSDTVVQTAREELEAAAWDLGYAAGFSNAMRRMSDEPNAPTSPNPFRASTSSLVQLVWHNGYGWRCPNCKIFVTLPESASSPTCPRCTRETEDT